MTTKKLHHLITKFLSDQLTDQEIKQLEALLEDSDNQTLFSEVVEANFASDYNLKQFSSEGLQEVLREKIRREKNPFRKRKIRSFLKYAAIFVAVCATGYLFKDALLGSSIENEIVPNEEFITLELDNGEIQKIRTNDSKVIHDQLGKTIGKQQQGVISYTDAETVETLIYNTLNVPYGKRFDIVLSDGTKVYMNAGSSLRYPVKFLKGNTRLVSLVGEAFFNVTHDTEHPFIVNAEAIDVEVLGTEFVMSTYKDETMSGVVLLEGSVSLSAQANSKEESMLLTPGFRGAFNKNTGDIEKTKVNTNIYTAWMEGILVFRNMSFNEISRKLERHYNVKIVNESNALGNEMFNANFHEEPIEIILSYFKDSYQMNYSIEENVIYIN